MASSKVTSITPSSVREAKSKSLAALIEKVTGQKQMGLTEGTLPHIATEIVGVDALIGGSPVTGKPDQLICPGFPKGRLIEIYGQESSGKTTLALAAIAACQREGGVCLFLDYENSLHMGYAKAIGVSFDPDKLLYYAPDTLEEGFKMMYMAITQGIDLIVVDSVAAMVPADELAKKLDDAAKIGALARAMAGTLPKMVQWLKKYPTCVIFLNQLRATINTSGGRAPAEDNTSGGKAIKFYASLRMKLTRVRSDFVEKVDPVTLKKKRAPYGNLVQVKMVKNKIDGKQGHSAEVFVRYGYGFDRYLSTIEGAIPRKLVTQKASSYTFEGETFKGRDALRRHLIANPEKYLKLNAALMKSLVSEAPEPVEDTETDDDIISKMASELGEDDEEGEDEAVEADSMLESEAG